MSGWIEVLNQLPLAGLMLTITLGYSLGRVSHRDVSLGPAAATLFVALALGYVGVQSGSQVPGGGNVLGLGAFGFGLFIYSVGFDAAPHFFSCFRDRRGWRFVGIGILVNVVAVTLTLLCARALDLDPSTSAGLLAGSLTSAPTFAAASETAPDQTALAVAFAITFPFGLLGIVLLIQLLPRVLKLDLAEGTVSDDELGAVSSVPSRRSSGPSPEVTRAFEVRVSEVAGKTLRELDLTGRTGCVISRLDQQGSVVIPDGETVLELGDHAMVTGRVDELRHFEREVGPEVDTAAFHAAQLPTRRIQVSQRQVPGHSLAELRILNRFHCVITRVERGSLWIEPDADVQLVRGDVIEAVGKRNDLRALARELGHFEQPVSETDIAVYAGGLLLGVLIGGLHLDVFGVSLRFGMAGGLLLMGLLLGVQDRIGPIRTHVPREARQLVRDLGILLFVGETGLAAGAGLVNGLGAAPWQTFVAGLFVNFATIGLALLIARRALGLRPVDAFGSVCGGLTSSAALQAVRRVSDSNEAAISYATAYAVASVFATIAGPLVVSWTR